MSDMNSFSLLQQQRTDRAALESFVATLSNEELLAALANSDHSEEAHRMIAESVAARGLHGEEGDGWMLAESSMFVKPLGPKPTFEEALASPVTWQHLYRLTLVVYLILSVFVLNIAYSASSDVYAYGIAGLGLVAAWFIPALWARPVRLLLLRPFQDKHVSKSLKRFVRESIDAHGHTFVLSDRFMKESRGMHVMSLMPNDVVSLFAFVLYLLVPPADNVSRALAAEHKR